MNVLTRTEAVVAAEGLYRFFHTPTDERIALRDVSVSVVAGEMVAIAGPSGSGKSTLLACLAGLDEPDGGTVRIAGEVMSRRAQPDRAALRRRAIGILFQSANLLDHLSLEDNLRLVEQLAGREDRTKRRQLLAALGLGNLVRSRPSELSGGELARAGLAVAVVNDPKVLLADEPTGELDRAAAARVIALMHECAERGMAVVVVTHDDAVATSADRVIRLMDGRVVP